MRINKKMTAILVLVLCICLLATGCSTNGTMFSTMKSAMALAGYEFSTDITLEENGVQKQIILSGEVSDNLEATLNIVAKIGDNSYDLKDIIRIVNGGIYLNAESLAQAAGLTGAADVKLTKWVKLSSVDISDNVKNDISQQYSDIIDKLEEISNGQDIPKVDGMYTLKFTDEDSVTFLNKIVNILDDNASGWYNSYVTVTDEAGISKSAIELLSAFWGSDIVDNLCGADSDAFKSSYNAWSSSTKDYLSGLEDKISKGRAKSSTQYSIAMSGDSGNHIFNESFSLENSLASGETYTINITNEKKQKSDVSIETIEDSEITDSTESLQAAYSLLNSLVDPSGKSDNKTLAIDNSLSQAQTDAIAATLKSNEMYLMNNTDGLEAVIVKYDNTNLELGSQVAEYYNSVASSRGEGVACSLFYEKGSITKGLKAKFKLYQYGDKTLTYKKSIKTVKTGGGKVSYFTRQNVSSEAKTTNVIFAIPVEADCYIDGYLEYSGKLDVKAFLQALFVGITKAQ